MSLATPNDANVQSDRRTAPGNPRRPARSNSLSKLWRVSARRPVRWWEVAGALYIPESVAARAKPYRPGLLTRTSRSVRQSGPVAFARRRLTRALGWMFPAARRIWRGPITSWPETLLATFLLPILIAVVLAIVIGIPVLIIYALGQSLSFLGPRGINFLGLVCLWIVVLSAYFIAPSSRLDSLRAVRQTRERRVTPLLRTPADADSLRAANDELARRRAVWSKPIDDLPTQNSQAPTWGLVFTPKLWLIAFAAMLGVSAISITSRESSSLSFIMINVLWAIPTFSLKSSIKRLSSCVANARCPDCSYALKGVPSRVLGTAELTLDLGPKRCPECGSPWPLIPPPPPNEPSTQKSNS
jgi:hypothetical protein